MAKSDKYEKGSILKFDNKIVDTVIVIGETIMNDEQYVLVAPYKEVEKDTVVTDEGSLLLLRVLEDDNICIETKQETVKPVLAEILKK